MKIYAITKGNYSGYHICALTVDKEKASRLREIYSDSYEDANIEEYYDGEGKDISVLWEYCENKAGYTHTVLYDRNDVREHVEFYPESSTFYVYVFANDREHAEKKAHDMIAEYKARKEGIC